MTESENTAPAQITRDEALKRSYAMATAALREENEGRFEELRVKFAAELGHEYKPKPKPVQIADAQIQALLEEFPELGEKWTVRRTAEVEPDVDLFTPNGAEDED